MPNPIQSICTRWGSDQFSYGSYSHVRIQSSGSDYDVLSESIGGRLFFAGEATTKQYPATMHGAYLSGLREASCILQATRGLKNNVRKSYARNGTLSSDTLTDLFRRPDIAFGKFMVVFNPFVEDPKGIGLMRVTFGSSDDDDDEKVVPNTYKRHPSNPPLHLYALVSRERALQLQQLPGGDDSKLSYLTNELGLKLMGFNALASFCPLISNIASARRSGRGRNRISAIQQITM